MRLRLLKIRKHLLLPNDACGASIDESAEGATQLVEISRPAERSERCPCSRREGATNVSGPTNLDQGGVDHFWHVDHPIAKRWDIDTQPLEPPKQLGPEAALANV